MINRDTSQNLNSSFVKNSIQPTHKSQVESLFAKIAGVDQARDKLSILGARDLGYLLGQEFDAEELTIFVNECLEEGDKGDMILLENVLSFLEKRAEQTKMDPYNLIRDQLMQLSESEMIINEGGNVDLVLLEYPPFTPRNLLKRYSFLEEFDRNLILSDLSYLSDTPWHGVNLDQLVSHIRNMLEGFAR